MTDTTRAASRLREDARAVVAAWDDKWIGCEAMVESIEALRAALRADQPREPEPEPQS